MGNLSRRAVIAFTSAAAGAYTASCYVSTEIPSLTLWAVRTHAEGVA